MSLQSFVYNPSKTTSAATGDGFSVPRNTTVGRLATVFTAADAGMMVFDTDFDNLFIWNGSAWESVPSSGDSTNEQVIFNDNGVLVGDPGLLFNKTTDKLTVATTIDISRGLLNDPTSTGVGENTLDATIAGAVRNTAIGHNSMYRATTADNNVAVGFNTLVAAGMTGTGNVAVGSGAGNAIASGDHNVAVGFNAMPFIVTGADNVAIGRNSLQGLTAGATNVGIGPNTLLALSTGSNNVAIGQTRTSSI